MVSHVVFNGISLMMSKIYSCTSLPYIHIPSLVRCLSKSFANFVNWGFCFIIEF